MLKLFKTEPAVFVTLFMASVGLLVSFGVPVTDKQQAAVYAVLTILAGIIVRSQVSPSNPLGFLGTEPAVLVSLGMAVLGLVASFGLNPSQEQSQAIYALLTIVSGLVIRSQVSPTTGE